MQKKTAKVLKSAGIALILSLTIFFAGICRTETKAVDSQVPAIGADVSSYNGNIDWYTAKASGLDFAIIRIGFGDDETNQDDPYAIINMNGCEAAGIPYGVYIYSYAISEREVDSEIAHTLRLIQGHNPQLGIWFDMEDADQYKLKHNFNPYTHGTQLTNFCVKFVEAFKARGYTNVGVYSNWDYFHNVLDYNRISSVGLIWLAHWGIDEPSMACAMWQFTSGGSMNGIPSTWEGIDMNKIYPNSPLYGIIHQSAPVEPDEPDEPVAPSIIRDDGTIICRGDVNGDDVIDVVDLAIVKKHILGKIQLRDDAYTLGDVNGDESIDVVDLAIIKKHILGKIDLFVINQSEQPTTVPETIQEG